MRVISRSAVSCMEKIVAVDISVWSNVLADLIFASEAFEVGLGHDTKYHLWR